MSWDIELEIDAGGDRMESLWDSNMTYNVSPMFYDAFEMETGFRGLDRMRTTEAVPILERAIKKMRADPDKYKAMESDNKWGTYDQALGFLKAVLYHCHKYPAATIRIY